MLVAVLAVSSDEDLVVITDSGIVMRMSQNQISTLGRATQGVRLIRLKDDQKVATVSLVMKEEENGEEVTETPTVEETTDTETNE